MLKYSFWVSIIMIVLVFLLIFTGRGQETVGTIIGSITGFWLGQSNNEQKKPNDKRGA